MVPLPLVANGWGFLFGGRVTFISVKFEIVSVYKQYGSAPSGR